MIKKILLVDDDPLLRRALSEQIEIFKEFETDQAENAKTGIEMAQSEEYAAILMDVGLPDMDGREACREIRQLGVMCPIIMLTGANSDADTILGLEAGANDYVTKPFKVNVLMARLRAQLRRYDQVHQSVLIIGPYAFNVEKKQLLDKKTDKTIKLTEKEVALLRYLHKKRGNLVEKEELLQNIWGYQPDMTTHTVETHIYRLRQKIETDPGNAKILLTESGGYRLAPAHD